MDTQHTLVMVSFATSIFIRLNPHPLIQKQLTFSLIELQTFIKFNSVEIFVPDSLVDI